jgi:hypothetical protein
MTTLQSQDARFARDLRLMSISEHLDREPDDIVDLIDPVKSFEAVRVSARRLQEWKDGGGQGPRPAGRLTPHVPEVLPRRHRLWAVPVYRAICDPDGRALRDPSAGRP